MFQAGEIIYGGKTSTTTQCHILFYLRHENKTAIMIISYETENAKNILGLWGLL